MKPIDPEVPAGCNGPSFGSVPRDTRLSDGRHAFVYSPVCNTVSVAVWQEDSTLLARVADPLTGEITGQYDLEYLRAPALGLTWPVSASGGSQFVWARQEDVTVPLGSYEDCWVRALAPAESSTVNATYCVGVGLVRLESTQENYVAELTRVDDSQTEQNTSP
jgi:hypothetical protein